METEARKDYQLQAHRACTHRAGLGLVCTHKPRALSATSLEPRKMNLSALRTKWGMHLEIIHSFSKYLSVYYVSGTASSRC